MLIEINFVCKNCGKEMVVDASIDENGAIRILQDACFCGHKISEQDKERIYHFSDTIFTFNQRNQFGKVVNVSLLRL